jgi:hypothetical protein
MSAVHSCAGAVRVLIVSARRAKNQKGIDSLIFQLKQDPQAL